MTSQDRRQLITSRDEISQGVGGGENKRVANAKLKRQLGVQLAYPTYREGLAALWRQGEGR